MVLVGAYELLDEKVEEILLEFELINPSKTKVELGIPKVKGNLQTTNFKNRLIGFNVAIGNLEFSTEGIYKFNVLVNGEKIGETDFEVKKI